MKIDIVLTACNMNTYYLNLYPYVYKVWKEKFNLNLYMILVSDSIPENLKLYKDYIILFEPIININSCYIAQVIRILYPSLFDNLNVLITDIDIIPISKTYFFDSIEKYTNDKFITYTDRYVNSNMYAICYNVANSKTWKNIFNINNIDDIKNILIKNYNTNYDGKKNCDGWYSDQKILYNYLMNYINTENELLVILKDKEIGYKRLDGKSTAKLNEIKTNKNSILENINIYSDFHIIRNYHVNKNLLEQIIDKILS
jgi:hypothetical protein